jgi:Zn-dependent protease with chaperone function
MLIKFLSLRSLRLCGENRFCTNLRREMIMTTPRATMDFFESQDDAKRQTFILTIYMILAVVFLIAGVYTAVAIVVNSYNKSAPAVFWQPQIFLCVALGVIAIVGSGSIFKIMALSKGGDSVAEMLGGVPVNPNTADPDQRRLLNVVEEMAIASGIPVPRVYVLSEETGINAFAAGFASSNAVVAVTQGCMKELTRDELQGVIAHEFSHILNGDMLLNIRLMGIVAGILVIGMIGRIIVRGSSSGRPGSRVRRGGGGVIILAGLIVMAVGYIGVFFCKLIKSAVSRQREFLADASAVQFTRNPAGIAGALAKIASRETGSLVHNAHAEEASHLFFGNGLSAPFMNLLATHPPIDVRIHRIDPTFKIKDYMRSAPTMEDESLSPGISAFSSQSAQTGTQEITLPSDLIASVGNPDAGHLDFASRLLSKLPSTVADALRKPISASSVIYCLLLSRDPETRAKQLQNLVEEPEPAALNQTRMLISFMDRLGAEYRLPIAGLAIPSLKLLSPSQYDVFQKNLKNLIDADNEVTIFEYALQRMMKHNLDPVFIKMPPPAVKYRVMDQVQVECFILLSCLAWRSNAGVHVAEGSFRRGLAELEIGGRPDVLAREKCGLSEADNALTRLSMASPQLKKKILKACIACITADSAITIDEAEMLRAIADTLDCPIPPFIPKTVRGPDVNA